MHAALETDSGHLVVDLAAVTFCDARGYALFSNAALAARATAKPIGYALSGLSPVRTRHAQMLWGRGGPCRYDTRKRGADRGRGKGYPPGGYLTQL